MALEMCINAKCLGQDTIIVLLYAVFCVVFGFVTALLVMLADKMKGDREESGQQSEQASAEVRNKNVFTSPHLSSRMEQTKHSRWTKMMCRKV